LLPGFTVGDAAAVVRLLSEGIGARVPFVVVALVAFVRWASGGYDRWFVAIAVASYFIRTHEVDILLTIVQATVPTNIVPFADRLSHYAFVFAFLASLTGLVSIAASHVCLGAALVLLLASKTPLRMPPVVLPLAGFMGLTIASMLASDDPLAGWPQLKKFYVFAFLVILYSLFQNIRQIERLYQAWFVAAGVAASLGVAQFVNKWVQLEATGGDFDVEYINDCFWQLHLAHFGGLFWPTL